MKLLVCLVAAAAVVPSFAASSKTNPTPERVPVPIVVTVRSAAGQAAPHLHASDVTVLQDKSPVPVAQLDRLSGDLADMQLFVLLDDSTRSSSLGLQLPELRKFIASLPATTQVAVGYMQHGSFGPVERFTADHEAAARALRLPTAIPGENGSPYFALSDLVKHWPAAQPATRRAVLMLTDGVDRYYTSAVIDDPYLDSAVHDALKRNIAVYSIYLRGAGLAGRGLWGTNVAQSRLMEVSGDTGGYAYFQDMTDPVSIDPFLTDLQDRFAHQYRVIINARNEKGVEPLKFSTELPGVKLEAPAQIAVH
jgi:hypothetical protein